jgi:hypothetical protein
MTKRGKIYDVLISHSPRDSGLASDVADACRESGLEAVTNAELFLREDAVDVLWEAVSESRALIAILPPSGLTERMAFEVGAAQGWNKPIFAIVTDPVATRLSPALHGIDLYTTGRVQDVIRAIKQSVEQLTDDDRTFLSQLYSGIGMSLDDLALEPWGLRDLVKRFKEGRGKVLSGERLLSELFRLRKQGRLRRHSSLPSTPSA